MLTQPKNTGFLIEGFECTSGFFLFLVIMPTPPTSAQSHCIEAACAAALASHAAASHAAAGFREAAQLLRSLEVLLPQRCSRDAPARHGTEDPEIYGTARHGKSWHGKILARHGTENLGTEKYWHGMARKIRPISYG